MTFGPYEIIQIDERSWRIESGFVRALLFAGAERALLVDTANVSGPLDEAVRLIQQRSRNYAKRQLTWFRRNPAMHWIFQPAQPDAEAVFAAARREIPFFAEEI